MNDKIPDTDDQINELPSRREFIRKAAYASPVLLTLPAVPSFAQQGSGAGSGDPNGDPITFTLSTAPRGMTINPVDGVIVDVSALEVKLALRLLRTPSSAQSLTFPRSGSSSPTLMRHLLYALLATARASLKSQRELALENLALRQQLAVVHRKTKRLCLLRTPTIAPSTGF